MNDYRPGNFSILPVVIKNLMIINALIYFATITMPKEIQVWIDHMFALHYVGSDLFKPHQIVTHIFMHGSFGHLFNNMFSLWIFGSILENYVGPKRFLTFYMACGIGAALCYMGVVAWENHQLTIMANQFLNNPTYENLLDLERKFNLGYITNKGIDGLLAALHANPNNVTAIDTGRFFVTDAVAAYRNIPMVGASGAVYGILFGAAYLFPNMLLYIYFLFPVKLKYAAAFMIIMEVVMAVQNNPGDNVAHFAHLGGVLFSFLLLRAWTRRGRQ
ncbi:rhomboid family intramembrane serine protease [Chitinophaga horti]|uniref:Rhomboid family intramembrane serine protease n=1 Tax=Chitinophaga horti TaxID=2920382 RepID=A0ABY6J407_9BACT|nr:rhomboid family intramembrane serine protease [Chitinophaga horti]UYQ92942.1 rhomboid family intramembrane serine protease [Chitinophaga horti]